VDDRGAARLHPDGHPRAAQLRPGVPDKGAVRRVVHLDKPGGHALFGDPGQNLLQDLVVGQAIDRLRQLSPECGPQGEDDLESAAALGRPHLAEKLAGVLPLPGQVIGRGLGLGDILHLLPASFVGAVPRARTAVVVGVVDPAQDVETGAKDGRGLEIVAQHALPPHLQQALCHVAIPRRVEGANHIQHRARSG